MNENTLTLALPGPVSPGIASAIYPVGSHLFVLDRVVRITGHMRHDPDSDVVDVIGEPTSDRAAERWARSEIVCLALAARAEVLHEHPNAFRTHLSPVPPLVGWLIRLALTERRSREADLLRTTLDASVAAIFSGDTGRAVNALGRLIAVIGTKE